MPAAAPHLDLLRRYHADATEHSGRRLIDHLQGVHALLEAWGDPADTCLAGLFHSIYGTNIFAHRSAPFSDRTIIRAAIGERAERFAFLFCTAERPVAFLKTALEGGAALADIVHGGANPVTRDDLAALIEIEMANFLEQPEDADDIRLLAGAIATIERAGPVLSPGARAALADYLNRQDAQPPR